MNSRSQSESSIGVHPNSSEYGKAFKQVQIASESFIESAQAPLVILGKISAQYRALVVEQLVRWKFPIYAEASSGLREAKELASWRIESGDGIFKNSQVGEIFDSVIRIGGIPTVRIWRDLENRFAAWSVLSFAEQKFSGLGREDQEALAMNQLKAVSFSEPHLRRARQKTWQILVLDQTRKNQFSGKNFWDAHSEPGVFRGLSERIPIGSLVFLGNSLPIREWDLAATFNDRDLRVISNRGANGIDGLFSTFLGAADAEHENWAILGDLSALYDLNAPWALPQAAGKKWRFVIINNFGGKIFKPLFNNPLFENEHQLNFEGFADLWKMDYFLWRRVPEDLPELPASVVIEIRPNVDATNEFWNSYHQI